MDYVMTGLVTLLKSFQKCTQVTTTDTEPCKTKDIWKWEQKYGVVMPQDMTEFYLAADGLKFRWNYQYSIDEARPVGMINIPRLADMIYINTSKSKSFLIQNLDNMALVCLVYKRKQPLTPKIYIFEIGTLKWRTIANSFTQYMQFSIAYLGLPYWQLKDPGYDQQGLEEFWIQLIRRNARNRAIFRKWGIRLTPI
uniref:Knr4/Smi1-like domain-containing protein n=1 Tax=Anopheles culicifacies TaxID=139723 RepID=A0A182LUC4_9DIPT